MRIVNSFLSALGLTVVVLTLYALCRAIYLICDARQIYSFCAILIFIISFIYLYKKVFK